MSSDHDPYTLPSGLPVPVDDGACAHLRGAAVPACPLTSTTGQIIDLATASEGCRVVAYFYPRTGRPGVDPPPGWDAIPGARGCTPQSCSFRDHYHEFETLDVKVFGVSTQSTEEQQEFAARALLPFPLLADPDLLFAKRLRMPTFELGGGRYYRRVTLVVAEQRVERAFHPVFPPDENAAEILMWLRSEKWSVRDG